MCVPAAEEGAASVRQRGSRASTAPSEDRQQPAAAAGQPLCHATIVLQRASFQLCGYSRMSGLFSRYKPDMLHHRL